MGALVRIGLVLAVFYVAGRIMYQGRERAHRLRVLHVLATFCVVMVVSALIMLALMAFSVAVEVALLSLDESVPELLVSPSGRLNGPNVLVYILLLIFLTAFAHYGLRRVVLRRWRFLALEEDEYQIFEYLIQWLTIYLVIYQCFFDGFATLAHWVQADDGTDLKQVFEIALSPGNINLVMQPLLVSSWVLVVIERFARKNETLRCGEGGPCDGETETGAGPAGGAASARSQQERRNPQRDGRARTATSAAGASGTSSGEPDAHAADADEVRPSGQDTNAADVDKPTPAKPDA